MKVIGPYGDLKLIRKYTCGCAEYHDHKNELWTIPGLFCGEGDPLKPNHPGTGEHKRTIAIGHATQANLFH